MTDGTQSDLMQALYLFPVPALQIDSAGTVGFLNPHATQLLMVLGLIEHIGNGWLLLAQLDPELPDRVRIADAALGTQLEQHRVTKLDARGVACDISITVAHVNPHQWMVVLENITERCKLERRLLDTQAKLLRAEKMASVGQLAAGMAHEINNPVGFVNSNLTALGGYVNTLLELIEGYDTAIATQADDSARAKLVSALKEKADLDFLKEDVTELVGQSLAGLQRVKQIVLALQDFAHAGHVEGQALDLNVALEDAVTLAQKSLARKDLFIKAYGKIPQFTCHPVQMNQVFRSLINNALDAIENDANGKVTVRTGSDQNTAWLVIGDTGPGMTAEVQTRVFEPFYTTKPVGKGMGLGLTVAHIIVQKHGGRIDVDSSPGKGSRFTVHLPLTLS